MSSISPLSFFLFFLRLRRQFRDVKSGHVMCDVARIAGRQIGQTTTVSLSFTYRLMLVLKPCHAPSCSMMGWP